MKFSTMSVAALAAGLIAGAPAFAQTTSPTTPAPAKKMQTAQKQRTDGEGPSSQLFSTKKQKAQSLSHSAGPGLAEGVTKQQ